LHGYAEDRLNDEHADRQYALEQVMFRLAALAADLRPPTAVSGCAAGQPAGDAPPAGGSVGWAALATTPPAWWWRPWSGWSWPAVTWLIGWRTRWRRRRPGWAASRNCWPAGPGRGRPTWCGSWWPARSVGTGSTWPITGSRC